MTKKQYAAYLQSEHWQTIRRITIEGYPECGRCDIPRWLAAIAYDQDLHVHHISYARLGNEKPSDLEVLCRRCHEIETFGRSDLKAPKDAVCQSCGSVHWDPYSELCSVCSALFGLSHETEDSLMLCDPWEHEPYWKSVVFTLLQLYRSNREFAEQLSEYVIARTRSHPPQPEPSQISDDDIPF